MTTSTLKATEFDPYYGRYIYKLPQGVLLKEGFRRGLAETTGFFQALPADKLSHRYALGKWSVKEILQHLIDTERIFMYRCFRIARRDDTMLAGFDQTRYINPSQAAEKPLASLLAEYRVGRQHSIALLDSLADEDLSAVGNANGSAMSARAAAFTIIGHDIWHMEIIKERYL